MDSSNCWECAVVVVDMYGWVGGWTDWYVGGRVSGWVWLGVLWKNILDISHSTCTLFLAYTAISKGLANQEFMSSILGFLITHPRLHSKTNAKDAGGHSCETNIVDMAVGLRESVGTRGGGELESRGGGKGVHDKYAICLGRTLNHALSSDKVLAYIDTHTHTYTYTYVYKRYVFSFEM